MATKSYERDFGCFAKAADDEPVFVLRAQDILAPAIVDLWVAAARLLGASTEKILAATMTADAMRNWDGKKKNPD